MKRCAWFPRFHFRHGLYSQGSLRSQKGAAKGYNPKKKGQKSYHPLLCFIAETRECLHNWFRPGNANSANGCVDFMKECLARIPKKVWNIVVRADSAFVIRFQDGKLNYRRRGASIDRVYAR